MVRISRCYDTELIRETIAHPKLYQHLSDDGCPDAEDFTVKLVDSMYYMAACDGDRYLGLFLLHPHNYVCYEVHTCLLPEAWGGTAIECGKAVVRWVFDNTPCQRLITNVPKCNRLALRLARNAGMSEFGVNEKSFMKNGVLHDQIMLGISKEASCLQQQ